MSVSFWRSALLQAKIVIWAHNSHLGNVSLRCDQQTQHPFATLVLPLSSQHLACHRVRTCAGKGNGGV